MLEGTLGDFSLPDIFQLIALTKKTGALTVTAGEQQGRVLFRGGEVCFAVADIRRVALGARLVASGLVNEDQITRVLERKREEGGDVVALLLDEAVLDEEAVDTFLRDQIEDAVFELMRLGAATFSFDASEDGDDDAVGLTVSTEHLIMEGGRRLGEWATIRERIPSMDAVLALSTDPASADQPLQVSREEWRLFALIDGHRTVRDVVELSGQGEFTTCKLLAELSERGFVQAVNDEEPDALATMVARREMLRRLEELELGAPVTPKAGKPEPAAPSIPAAPPSPPPQESSPKAPPPAGEQIDRTQVARELASLGTSLPEAPAPGTNGSGHAQAAAQARPLTRDEDVNKGLLLRLIDGVKGA